MILLLKVGVLLVTFLFMEFVAWFTHKYVMHGIMWSWHKSHHRVHRSFFEKNDLFAVVFSIPSIVLIAIGYDGVTFSVISFIGFGIMMYGVFYSIFHDIIVHRRIKIRLTIKSLYMKRIINAHYIHHTCHNKKGAKAFGFLYAPKKYAEK